MAKAKDGSECFTRTNKSGGKYVTCEGTQKGGAKMSANKKVTQEQQKRSQKRKKDNQAAAKADKAIKEASDRIKKKKAAAKPKPKAKVAAIKVVRGTKKSIDLAPTEKEAAARPSAKAKAGEVTIKTTHAPSGKKTTMTYKVPKHSVNQTESVKLLRNVYKELLEEKLRGAKDGETGGAIEDIVHERIGHLARFPVHSDEKPYVIDAKLTFKEGEKKGTLSYKQLDPDRLPAEGLESKTRTIGAKFKIHRKTIYRKI